MRKKIEGELADNNHRTAVALDFGVLSMLPNVLRFCGCLEPSRVVTLRRAIFVFHSKTKSSTSSTYPVICVTENMGKRAVKIFYDVEGSSLLALSRSSCIDKKGVQRKKACSLLRMVT